MREREDSKMIPRFLVWVRRWQVIHREKQQQGSWVCREIEGK